jgi:hypothetical protein
MVAGELPEIDVCRSRPPAGPSGHGRPAATHREDVSVDGRCGPVAAPHPR